MMINPPSDYWKDYAKPKFIEQTLKDICENIAKKGSATHFEDVFTSLYEYIEDNIEKFLPEENHD